MCASKNAPSRRPPQGVEPAELRVHPEELESAAWFSRAELLNSPEDDRFRLPRADSIARCLIEDWLAGGR